jgi:N-acetylmuramoyl-L-alanine amidase
MGMTTANAKLGRRGRRRQPSRWIAFGVVVVAVTVVLAHPWSWSSAQNTRSHVSPVSGATRRTTIPLDPEAFATGSCVALAPASGDRHKTVFLDAGHGGPDPGTATGTTAAGQTVEEKTVTLVVGLDTAQLLRAQGYRVVLSRTADGSVARLTSADLHGALLTTAGDHADLIARVTCANLADADALVSIHFDSYPDPGVGGATSLYDVVRPFSSANQALAGALQHDIVTSFMARGWQIADRGITNDSTAGGGEITAAGTAYGHLDLLGPNDPGYVDHPTTMPGALVEPLFLSNPAEAAVALNPAGQHAIATGIADAVNQFLRVTDHAHR